VKLDPKQAKEQGRLFGTHSIIKGVSGYAMPGQTLYIMGSSGAGKTSLLNILSDRINKSRGAKLTGKVLINDEVDLTQDNFGNLAGYAMQDDILYANFTPREALRFAARLKLEASVAEQNKRVEELIEELGLLAVANTPIGSVRRKTISGGERKRTAIGVELITDPSVLLLDEPTSGLDSFKATQLV
jgi:ABC-type multidrug transport system ATPase subunit